MDVRTAFVIRIAVVTIRLGEIAPDFAADSTRGPIRLHAWKLGSWAMLFSHPDELTPVCTTELSAVAALEAEFARRNTKVIALTTQRLESLDRLRVYIAAATGRTVTFPIVADPDRRVAELYGLVEPGVSAAMMVRSVFVIGPDDRVKLTLAYPASTGRNFDELLRVLDSLQLATTHPVATPANWRRGERVIVNPPATDGGQRRTPNGGDGDASFPRYTAHRAP
jgi:thioredoxin-dependent peroxiredoxin